MAKFGIMVEAVGNVGQLALGFSWGDGGPAHTTIYIALSIPTSAEASFHSERPVDIPGGFPGLHGKRIFLDVMGSSVGRAFLDVDFKIYEADGTRPIYQIPTTSMPVIGVCLDSLVINTTIRRGGNLAVHRSSGGLAYGKMQLIAHHMGLVPMGSRSSPGEAAHEPGSSGSGSQFCGFTRGARLRAAMGMCP